jgi:hypothetical protein
MTGCGLDSLETCPAAHLVPGVWATHVTHGEQMARPIGRARRAWTRLRRDTCCSNHSPMVARNVERGLASPSGERKESTFKHGRGRTLQRLGPRDGNLMGWDKEAADAAVCACVAVWQDMSDGRQICLGSARLLMMDKRGEWKGQRNCCYISNCFKVEALILLRTHMTGRRRNGTVSKQALRNNVPVYQYLFQSPFTEYLCSRRPPRSQSAAALSFLTQPLSQLLSLI